MKAFWLAALLCLSGLAVASQPPVPSPSVSAAQPQATAGQYHGNASSGDANAHPLAVVVVKEPQPQRVHDPSHDEGNYTWEGASPDWGLVHVTELLCGITAILALFTGALFFATRGLANDARAGTEIATKAMIASERAYVFPEFVYRDPEILDGRGDWTVLFRNCGKTPAIIRNQLGWMTFKPINEPPSSLPDEASGVEPLPPGLVIPSMASTVGQDIPTSKMQPIYTEDSQVELYLIGIIRYDDVFGGDTKVTQFCWRYVANWDRFELSVASKLNYFT